MPQHAHTVGLVAGTFDLPHAGHVLMLAEAKSLCERLIVALHVDPSREHSHKRPPIMSVGEREIMLRAIRYVDDVVRYETESELFDLLSDRVDLRVLGIEYKDRPFTGSQLPIRVHFTGRDHGFSTTELRRRVWSAEQCLNAA